MVVQKLFVVVENFYGNNEQYLLILRTRKLVEKEQNRLDPNGLAQQWNAGMVAAIRCVCCVTSRKQNLVWGSIS